MLGTATVPNLVERLQEKEGGRLEKPRTCFLTWLAYVELLTFGLLLTTSSWGRVWDSYSAIQLNCY